jgi:hypothetical protein
MRGPGENTFDVILRVSIIRTREAPGVLGKRLAGKAFGYSGGDRGRTRSRLRARWSISARPPTSAGRRRYRSSGLEPWHPLIEHLAVVWGVVMVYYPGLGGPLQQTKRNRQYWFHSTPYEYTPYPSLESTYTVYAPYSSSPLRHKPA